MEAVFDTSPLQALHRGGVLGWVPRLFDGVRIPAGVARETREYAAKAAPDLVPALDDLPWIEVAGVVVTGAGRTVDLEVVALAADTAAAAVTDDRRAIRAATDRGVVVITTRELVAELGRRGWIADPVEVVRRIEATGYVPLRRGPRTWPS